MARGILVATGVWTKYNLWDCPRLFLKTGVSFTWGLSGFRWPGAILRLHRTEHPFRAFQPHPAFYFFYSSFSATLSYLLEFCYLDQFTIASRSDTHAHARTHAHTVIDLFVTKRQRNKTNSPCQIRWRHQDLKPVCFTRHQQVKEKASWV